MDRELADVRRSHKVDTMKVIKKKETNLIETLNEKQKLFCKLYTSDREFFGNGLQAYMEAYNIPSFKWKSAATAATRLLKNDKVLQYVNSLLELRGLNDGFVDKQLEFLVTQHADFKSKLGAIREYNQLKKRVSQEGGNIVQLNQIILKIDNILQDDSLRESQQTP